MTEPNGNGARDLRDAIGEAHAEKHDLESEQLQEARKAHSDKHDSEARAVDMAIQTERQRLIDHRISHDAAHAAHEALHAAFGDAHKQQHASEHAAVAAATAALDKRLDGMNEFRDQLRDQASTFVRIDAFDSFRDERRQALTALEGNLDNRLEALRTLIQTEREERRATEGAKKGINQSTAIIVGAITLAATIITVVVVIINFVTATP